MFRICKNTLIVRDSMNLKTKSGGREILIILTAAVILIILSVAAIGLGSVKISIPEVLQALFHPGEELTATESIVRNVRLPRILIAVFVGMALACSGCIIQAVMRNPMADPGIIGVSSGASFVTILVMLVFPSLYRSIPLFSFLGAVLACIVISALAYVNNTLSSARLILAGVAVNSIFGAGTSIISVLHSDELGGVIMWLNGSLVGKSWNDARLLIPYLTVGLILAVFCIPTANILQLGDENARSLGVNLDRSRLLLTLLGAFLAGITVSFVGIIGFVGLVIHHVSRMLVSSDYKYMMPLSVVLGGILLLLADTCARTLFMPTELPVGSLIAIVGGPFFIYLLRKSQKVQ